MFLLTLANVVGAFVSVTIIVPWFLIAVAVVMIVCCGFSLYYRASAWMRFSGHRCTRESADCGRQKPCLRAYVGLQIISHQSFVVASSSFVISRSVAMLPMTMTFIPIANSMTSGRSFRFRRPSPAPSEPG